MNDTIENMQNQLKDIEKQIDALTDKKCSIQTEIIKSKLQCDSLKNNIKHISLNKIDHVRTDNFEIEGYIDIGLDAYDISYVYDNWLGRSKVKINGEQNMYDIDNICDIYQVSLSELYDTIRTCFDDEYISFDDFVYIK